MEKATGKNLPKFTETDFEELTRHADNDEETWDFYIDQFIVKILANENVKWYK